jgi:hypothetical protein
MHESGEPPAPNNNIQSRLTRFPTSPLSSCHQKQRQIRPETRVARLAQLSQFPFPMGYYTSIAELQRAGIVVRASEAVAVVQKLINERPPGRPKPPFAPPSTRNVLVDDQGNVACTGCDVKPAVSEIAILLEAMLPPGTRMPGSLHYTIARALLNVDAPPFGSIEELSSALRRFERNDRDHVIRGLVMRAREASAGDAHASIIPFRSPAAMRVKTERRRPVSAALAAELRRELRRADLERYARRAASTIPDLRGALAQHKQPISVVAAGVAAGILLIASGEVMQVRGAVEEWSLPHVAVPAPQIPAAVSAFPVPSDFFDQAIVPRSRPPAISAPANPLSRQASYATSDRRPAATNRPRKLRVERDVPATPRPSGSGVLSRLRLQWVRSLFTYRRDL